MTRSWDESRRRACAVAAGTLVAMALLLGCGGKNDEAAAAAKCGGMLTGQWSAEGTAPVRGNLNGCSNLVLDSSTGQLAARTNYPPPKQRSFLMRFNADGTYSASIVNHGSVTLSYAPACLITAQGSPSCTQLGEALLDFGVGSGTIQQVSCSDGAAGGCDCTLEVNEVGGPAGEYVADTTTGELQLTRNQAEMLDTSYCVNATSLRFGPEIEAWFGGASQVTFSASSCDDGVQGPGESGVDCGPGCPNPCP